MDIFLIILGSICLLVGLIGCIVPMLPGPPIAYVALVLLQLTDKVTSCRSDSDTRLFCPDVWSEAIRRYGLGKLGLYYRYVCRTLSISALGCYYWSVCRCIYRRVVGRQGNEACTESRIRGFYRFSFGHCTQSSRMWMVYLLLYPCISIAKLSVSSQHERISTYRLATHYKKRSRIARVG